MAVGPGRAPTPVLLFGAASGWWSSRTVANGVLAVNVVLLCA
ncbi:hypothetical protein [Streptomyces alfalfae]